MKKVYFKNGANKISAIVMYPDILKEQNPALLVIHGWRSAKERYPDRVKDIVEKGFIALILDLPGHGESEGDISTMIRKDYVGGVISAYDYLLSLSSVDKNRIGVEGSSFGGYLAILLSAKRDVKWLALKNPANYPDIGENEPQMSVPNIIYKGHKGIWGEQPLNVSENTAIKALSEYKGEILLMQSEKDEIIPKQTFINYLSAIRDKSRLTHAVIKDADHRTSDPKWEKEYIKIHTEWFASKV